MAKDKKLTVDAVMAKVRKALDKKSYQGWEKTQLGKYSGEDFLNRAISFLVKIDNAGFLNDYNDKKRLPRLVKTLVEYISFPIREKKRRSVWYDYEIRNYFETGPEIPLRVVIGYTFNLSDSLEFDKAVALIDAAKKNKP